MFDLARKIRAVVAKGAQEELSSYGRFIRRRGTGSSCGVSTKGKGSGHYVGLVSVRVRGTMDQTDTGTWRSCWWWGHGQLGKQ